MTTAIKSYATYEEFGIVGLSIRFTVLILLHDDYSETHPEPVEPLIELEHYNLLIRRPRCVRNNEIDKIFNDCYEAYSRS